MALLTITNLHARVEGKPVLQGVSFKVEKGEICALMGQNGSGKSSLAAVVVGHPGYEVTKGSITFSRKKLLKLKPEERARAGVFLSWQYPREIAGVTLGNFLRVAYNATHQKPLSVSSFLAFLKQKMDLLKMPHDFIMRSVNEGFSGGEKKRAEMLQLAVLEPKLAILDEVDSGLDIDALRIVTDALTTIKQTHPDMSLVIITHYQRVLQAIPPDKVLVMHQGSISKEGTRALADRIETHGYETVVV